VKLILGVLDVAYSGKDPTTTGEVATYLEDEYHVMRIFYEEYQHRIGKWLADAIADQIQDMARGAPINPDPFMDGTGKIEDAFRRFLAAGEIERISPSLPTQAALDRRSKRFKKGKGPERPSFIDTGLYQSTFRAWMQDDQSAPFSDVPF